MDKKYKSTKSLDKTPLSVNLRTFSVYSVYPQNRKVQLRPRPPVAEPLSSHHGTQQQKNSGQTSKMFNFLRKLKRHERAVGRLPGIKRLCKYLQITLASNCHAFAVFGSIKRAMVCIRLELPI